VQTAGPSVVAGHDETGAQLGAVVDAVVGEQRLGELQREGFRCTVF
jgi:alpha-D-ribose 1-methylphosphonate 5-triphosphate synthase subunit PhnG